MSWETRVLGIVSYCFEQPTEGTYVDLSVQVVPVIEFGSTTVVPGAGERFTRLGNAIAVAAKTEMRSVSCILVTSDQP